MGSRRESLNKRVRETVSRLSDEELVKLLSEPSHTPFARRVAWEEISKRKRLKETDELASGVLMVDPGAFRKDSSGDPRAGCYIEFWSDKEFEGECLRIEGPAECQALESSDLEWGNSISSLRVGPGAFVLVYDEKAFKGRMTSFGPGQEVADLEEHIFNDEIDSIKVVNSLKVFDGSRAEVDAKPTSQETKRKTRAGRSRT